MRKNTYYRSVLLLFTVFLLFVIWSVPGVLYETREESNFEPFSSDIEAPDSILFVHPGLCNNTVGNNFEITNSEIEEMVQLHKTK